MLVFEERGKSEYPEKNLLEQRREPTTNSTHIWRRRRDLNPGNIGGRRAISPLRHPLLPSLLVEDDSTKISTFFRQQFNKLPFLIYPGDRLSYKNEGGVRPTIKGTCTASFALASKDRH